MRLPPYIKGEDDMETLERLEEEARNAMNQASAESGSLAETVYELANTVLNLVQYINESEQAMPK